MVRGGFNPTASAVDFRQPNRHAFCSAEVLAFLGANDDIGGRLIDVGLHLSGNRAVEKDGFCLGGFLDRFFEL